MQIEVDATTFTVSQTCEVPVMYREMVNPSRNIWFYFLLPPAPSCFIESSLAVRTHTAITLLQIQPVRHISLKQPIPFHAWNFGSKKFSGFVFAPLNILTDLTPRPATRHSPNAAMWTVQYFLARKSVRWPHAGMQWLCNLVTFVCEIDP